MAFNPDCPAVLLYHGFDVEQSDSVSFNRSPVLIRDPVELVEDVRQMFFGYPDSIVCYAY